MFSVQSLGRIRLLPSVLPSEKLRISLKLCLSPLRLCNLLSKPQHQLSLFFPSFPTKM